MTTKLDHALRYAQELRWAIFPLAQYKKLPLIAKSDGGNGVHDATNDPARMREWWERWPKANIGIACGPESGIIVIDVDPRNGGDKSLAALAARGYMLPPCPRARTGNGGLHFVLKDDPRVTNSKGRLGRGIDVKAGGGYIVAAPSRIGPSENGPGGIYEWEVSPFETPLPRAPIWLTTLLTPPPRPKIGFHGTGRGSIDGLVRTVGSAREGNRNGLLYWATRRVDEDGRATSSNIGRLVAAARHVGLSYGEAIMTIKSALDAGRSGGMHEK